jgi:DNA-binding NarL/FixJ family response regulator
VIEFHRLGQEQDCLNRGLSLVEIDLLRFASNGYTNKEIGKEVFWSEIQVKRKMQDIYQKLQVTELTGHRQLRRLCVAALSNCGTNHKEGDTNDRVPTMWNHQRRRRQKL